MRFDELVLVRLVRPDDWAPLPADEEAQVQDANLAAVVDLHVRGAARGGPGRRRRRAGARLRRHDVRPRGGPGGVGRGALPRSEAEAEG